MKLITTVAILFFSIPVFSQTSIFLAVNSTEVFTDPSASILVGVDYEHKGVRLGLAYHKIIAEQEAMFSEDIIAHMGRVSLQYAATVKRFKIAGGAYAAYDENLGFDTGALLDIRFAIQDEVSFGIFASRSILDLSEYKDVYITSIGLGLAYWIK